MNTTQANGGKPVELPQDRVLATLRDAGKEYYQAAHERDELAREVLNLKTELAAARVIIDAHVATIATMESRIESASLMRDQAIADRAKWESLFISVQAQMRAFAVPSAPLVTAAPDETGQG